MENISDLQERVRVVFSEYLSEKGHRKTPERFAILAEIYGINGHCHNEELYKNMKNKNTILINSNTSIAGDIEVVWCSTDTYNLKTQYG